jgi:hypothetical protein
MFFGLSPDDRVRFADCLAFVAKPLQGFVGDLCPKLLQRWRRRLARVPLGVIRGPRHVFDLPSEVSVRHRGGDNIMKHPGQFRFARVGGTRKRSARATFG